MSGLTAAVLLAGGSGTRVKREVNKLYLPVAGREVIAFPLLTLDHCAAVDRVVLVVRETDRALAGQVIDSQPLAKPPLIVDGGTTRSESERAGLEALAPAIESGEVGLVAIHDGARPFMTTALLERIVEAARHSGGAIPGLAVDEALYRLTPAKVEPLDAHSLRRVQTPQAFEARPLLESHRLAAAEGFGGADTAETVQRYTDLTVTVVPGDPRNIKVTYVEDFFRAEELAGLWREGSWVDR